MIFPPCQPSAPISRDKQLEKLHIFLTPSTICCGLTEKGEFANSAPAGMILLQLQKPDKI